MPGGESAIRITGDRALIAKFHRLARVDAKRVLRKATREASKVILPMARKLAPKRTGALRKAIRVRATKRSRVYIGARVVVGKEWFTGEQFYGGFQEWGWRTGKRGASKRRPVPGKHFLQQAYDQGGPAACYRAERVFRHEILLAAARP